MSKESPYLAVDFDVLEKCGPAGASCGLSGEQIFMALGRLWLFCWRGKTEHVTTTHIRGFFYGADACEALLAFGFIAASPEGWRVKGADRWLFVQRARSENGKKAAANGNLKRGTNSPNKVPAPTPSSPASSQQSPSTPPNSAPALTATSDKRPTTGEEEKPLRDEPHLLQTIWNAEVAPPLPRWTTTDGARLKHADARQREHPDPNFWVDVCQRINRSELLSGRKGDWRATPDWVLKPANLIKIIEGNYEPGPSRPTGAAKGPIAPSTQNHVSGAILDF